MTEIAFVTCEKYPDLTPDDRLLLPPLLELGIRVTPGNWRDPQFPWEHFPLAVVRSPWDYSLFPERFNQWIQSTARRTTLENHPALLRWNSDKRYLFELRDQGVPIVPTQLFPIGGRGLLSAIDQLKAEEFVIKPVVSAGARETFRIRRTEWPQVGQRILALAHREALFLQPFCPGIVTRGESSLIFIGGQFSHAILKVPRRGDFRSQEEFGGHITPLIPTSLEREVARNLITHLVPTPLYGRVDLIPGGDGKPLVVELEILEPALYFAYDADSPRRMARAIADLVQNSFYF